MSAEPAGEFGQQVVHVGLSERSYDIRIGLGVLAELPGWMIEKLRPTHVVIMADEHVSAAQQLVAGGLVAAEIRVDVLEIPSGETSKCVARWESLCESLRACQSDRKSVVVAIGGGVVGDLAGFVAASYARGLRFVQVPTTLLACVDSSVGGKTGINLSTAKNMVGAFWQPEGVFIDLATLETLPSREFVSGMAEVVKYGVILDEGLFSGLEHGVERILARDPKVLVPMIARSCELKARVVSEDERETTGLRAILNYGHTFAHAFENLLGYGTLLHGEAVSIGMVCASRLAERLGLVTEDVTQRQLDLLQSLGLPVRPPELDDGEVLAAMRRDKKVEHGALKFILPTGIGEVKSVGEVDDRLVVEAMSSLRG